MSEDNVLQQARELLTEYLGVPFEIGEWGGGPQDIERAQTRLFNEVLSIIGPDDTCIICGAQFPVFSEHECEEVNGWP
jgi:hypothetical protein